MYEFPQAPDAALLNLLIARRCTKSPDVRVLSPRDSLAEARDDRRDRRRGAADSAREESAWRTAISSSINPEAASAGRGERLCFDAVAFFYQVKSMIGKSFFFFRRDGEVNGLFNG